MDKCSKIERTLITDGSIDKVTLFSMYGQLKILRSSVKSESDFQKRSKVILSSSIESGVVAVSAALLKQCAITTFKKCFLAMMTIMVEHQ